VASSGLPKPIGAGSDQRARDSTHIGFDVKDPQAFIKKTEAEGIKLDEAYRKDEATGPAITYVTDARGARVELVQRRPMPQNPVPRVQNRMQY